MRIGNEHGQSQAIQRVHGFTPVDGRCQNQIRLECHDLLEIRIHGAAHVRLLRGCGRIIAEVGIPGQLIASAQSKNNFSEVRRKRDDALHIRWNLHAPPGFVGEHTAWPEAFAEGATCATRDCARNCVRPTEARKAARELARR